MCNNYVLAESEFAEWDKDYLVIDENGHSPYSLTRKGLLIAGFDTREEAEALVEELDSPGHVILGPR
ncbi:MAG: hypothetical protein IJ899_03060 [Blautia sp.]|nr:hypothetical protein [Blautia sp.]